MGTVIRSRVVNIFEIPTDVLIQLVGPGFEVNENGKLGMDRHIDEDRSFEFVVQNDSSLWLEGRKLMLTKFFRKLKVLKNRHGHIVDMVEVGSWESTDEVLLTDYGALMNPGKSSHERSFYK